MDLEIYETKEFLKTLKAMKLAGGRKNKAADQVLIMRSSVGLIESPFQSLRKTKHGESRIAGCVKYDLNDFCRLVTVTGNGCIFLLFIGDHDEVDAWLEKNRGLTIGSVSGESLGRTKISDGESGLTIINEPDNWSGALLDRLPTDVFENLLGDLPSRQVQPIWQVRAGSPESVIRASVAQISDEKLQLALFDILVLLNGGSVEEAQNRALHHLGSFRPIAELSTEELLELDMGDGIRKIELGSKEYSEWVARFIETSHPFDWFLFMHPEQEKHVTADYSGPAKLSGVTGSGKTSIAVKRAVRLAGEFEDQKILLLSLNRALCEFISEIVDHACGSDAALRSRIEVNSLFSICQSLLEEFEPANDKLYSDVTWRLEEHKDEVYREFYRCLSNSDDAEVLRPMHRLLTSQSIDAERYIADEFDWIRSAVGRARRADYISIARQGRGYKILEQHRAAILEGLEGWERKMSAVGVIDYMGVVTAVTRHIDKIAPRYRSILVDEAQDFGSIELSIIRRLVKPDRNDLFLCGDAAQHILPKHQSFDAAGIDVKGRSSRIVRNYRNSREILKLAHRVLTLNLSESHFELGELEISDPELSYRSSSEPLLLQTSSLDMEIAAALQLLNTNDELAHRRGTNHSGCIAIVGYSSFEVQQYGKEIGVPVLDGASKFLHGTRFLSDLEQTKGYEFDTMVIVNCARGHLPPSGAPQQEVFRSASEFYVAMTRAKNQLVLSFSGTLCDWLTTLNLPISLWSDVVDTDGLTAVGIPGFLQEFPDAENFNLRDLTGTEFIFTPYARGLDVELQGKLENLVDGRGMIQAGTQRRLKWKNIGALIDDLESGHGTSALGPVAREVINTRLAEASLGLRPSIRPKPVRKRPSPPIQVGPPAASIESRPIIRDTPPSGGLDKLGLATREMMILHSLNIRTRQDLLAADDRVLEKYLTKTAVKTLKQLARATRKHAVSAARRDIPLVDADLSSHIIDTLLKKGLTRLTDLARLSESDLWALSQFSKRDVQRILRVCRDQGVALSDT
ncbi:UvrD-helicase domain-containing protein [Bradyrhizobium sp. AUGA SZCCT0274]|uniref:UvrD-helicase domain-containing protein n=1 Tax=Bradyrhizobium sp. AUGA SZCCT0274 TaxID=2807670 RepID=UPI001BAD0515|nr:UvrD-helicase domain-containing protein [Bradyrhizobium sp. AUGA SZCCT0274]MBR1240257.1 UvrD-helicase domain-containing protein [Bradyrhizobium sp. AUGA SZCCT0274]